MIHRRYRALDKVRKAERSGTKRCSCQAKREITGQRYLSSPNSGCLWRPETTSTEISLEISGFSFGFRELAVSTAEVFQNRDVFKILRWKKWKKIRIIESHPFFPISFDIQFIVQNSLTMHVDINCTIWSNKYEIIPNWCINDDYFIVEMKGRLLNIIFIWINMV